MVRPRWLSPQRVPPGRGWRHWDRFVAVWASVNLLWVGFDLTYVPLRTFWLQRTLYPFPSLPLAVPLTLLPSEPDGVRRYPQVASVVLRSSWATLVIQPLLPRYR